MKVQTFCNVIFGNHRQVWNRDIDRSAPSWLLNELSLRTGTPPTATFCTTLRSYEEILYRKSKASGALHWILVLQMYHRKRNGHGLQFCPTCLAEDAIPYFRKCWRIALNTVCTIHQTMLLDRCPACGASVAVHRLDMNEQDLDMARFMSCCHACELDLRTAPTAVPISYDAQTAMLLREANQALAPACEMSSAWSLDSYSVMHQLCRMMTARYEHARLRHFVLDSLGFPDIHLTGGHTSFEMRPIEQRHHLMQLGAWLLADLEPRLCAAWYAGAIRYNLLLKDFRDAPVWYVDIVSKLSNWRERTR